MFSSLVMAPASAAPMARDPPGSRLLPALVSAVLARPSGMPLLGVTGAEAARGDEALKSLTLNSASLRRSSADCTTAEFPFLLPLRVGVVCGEKRALLLLLLLLAGARGLRGVSSALPLATTAERSCATRCW